MDGTTDVSKMEDEAVVMMYCKRDRFLKEINHARDTCQFLTLTELILMVYYKVLERC